MLNDWIDAGLAAIASLDPVLRVLLAGVMILLETSVLVGLIVPGDTVVLLASTAIHGWAEWAWTVAAVIVGALCGESIGYWIGRWLGPRAHETALARRIGLERIAKADALIRRRGGPAIFLSRFALVLHSLVPLVAGMAGIRYRRFLAWTAPACVLWAVAYVSAGSLATAGYRELSRELHWAGAALIGAVLLVALAVWAARRVLGRHLEAASAPLEDGGAPEPEAPAEAGVDAQRDAREDAEEPAPGGSSVSRGGGRGRASSR